MSYAWAANPYLIVPSIVLFAVLFGSFVLAFWAMTKVTTQADRLDESDENQGLSWHQSLRQRQSRIDQMWVDPKFAWERMLYERSTTTFIVAFALQVVLMFAFGNPS
ncbi:hypothetical protein J1C56_04155 [Aminobacter anthyllidis]|uniref:Uncharacterized protein n=1 Tax=Aminobacter anthyllidis TaxID=1035067 RepID=A0A9X1A8C2_9HYPH|nr:hypothetical protein [Aminobacter anthyllidis]MBT1154777.1 hypothetical protein [Aminobacter anthyllidis]